MKYHLTLTAIAALLTTPAMAEDRALILANENYRNAADISAADNALDAEDALREAGFSVVTGSDLPAEGLRDALAEMLASDTDRVVILLTGHFVQSASETWFLGTEANRPNLANIGGESIALSTVLEVAAQSPGNAIVLLGTEARRIRLGTGLEQGIGALDVPQGVTVLSGDAGTVADFAADTLPQPGQPLADLAAQEPGLAAQGYLGGLAPFLPETQTRPAPSQPNSLSEIAMWQRTRSLGTIEAYEEFLRRYPRGVFALAARAQIDRLQAEDPARNAEGAEAALRLTRDQRRAIQRNLSLLDIDPRGIDGVFGRGSRAAISTWQGRNNFDQTGFLTRDQISQIAGQAEVRAAELEEEARVRQLEQDRQDQAYWDQTGRAGDEAGLRAYLRRYPDGLFADLAQDRLAVFEEERRDQAAAQDRANWDRARNANTVRAYRGYLEAFPRGAFADEARGRIAALVEGEDDDRARQAAERVEASLNLPPIARNMIEARLQQLGLRPGRVDGRFDDDTRRAIRRYQQAQGLAATGYLDQQTVSRFLAGGVIRFGD